MMMKTFSLSGFLSVFLGVVCALSADSEPYAIWDFSTAAPNYGYEGWSDLGAVGSASEEGWEVDGPAAGGFGLVFNQLLNLEGVPKLRLSLAKCDLNTEGTLFIKLISTNDTYVVFPIPLTDIVSGSMETIEIDMLSPHETSQELPDLSAIQQIQIQGSFNPGNRTHVRFGRLEALLE